MDYIETKSNDSTPTTTPSGRPYMVTYSENHSYPHIITYKNEYIYSEPSLNIVADVQYLLTSQIEYPSTEPSDETIQKNSAEPLYTHNIIFHP